MAHDGTCCCCCRRGARSPGAGKACLTSCSRLPVSRQRQESHLPLCARSRNPRHGGPESPPHGRAGTREAEVHPGSPGLQPAGRRARAGPFPGEALPVTSGCPPPGAWGQCRAWLGPGLALDSGCYRRGAWGAQREPPGGPSGSAMVRDNFVSFVTRATCWVLY